VVQTNQERDRRLPVAGDSSLYLPLITLGITQSWKPSVPQTHCCTGNFVTGDEVIHGFICSPGPVERETHLMLVYSLSSPIISSFSRIPPHLATKILLYIHPSSSLPNIHLRQPHLITNHHHEVLLLSSSPHAPQRPSICSDSYSILCKDMYCQRHRQFNHLWSQRSLVPMFQRQPTRHRKRLHPLCRESLQRP
jgi:hypothetical protein